MTTEELRALLREAEEYVRLEAEPPNPYEQRDAEAAKVCAGLIAAIADLEGKVIVPVTGLELLEACARAGQVNAHKNYPNLEGDFVAIRARLNRFTAAQENKDD